MKKRKATLMTLLGIVALALALTVYPPNQASARSETEQRISTLCEGCNIPGFACAAGTKQCTPAPCTACNEQ